jgi:Arc/MetJ family transcription regulator
MDLMGRTNIDIDEDLIQRVMEAYGFDTMREAVHYALDQLVGPGDPKEILELRGMGWGGDLDVIRGRKPSP